MEVVRKPRAVRAPRVKCQAAAAYAAAPVTLTDSEVLQRAAAILAKTLERGPALTDPAAAGSFLSCNLREHKREIFAVMFLDTSHRMIEYRELFAGGLDGCEVHPREVARVALECNAAAVILAHNHPSGNPEPSAADRAVTARLKTALALFDVRLLDHFIVGEGPALSMAARGLV